MASPHTLSAPAMQAARSSPAAPASPTASPVLLAKPRALSASTASGSGRGSGSGSSSSSSRQAPHPPDGAAQAPAMGKLQTTYRALQVRARSSWLDLRNGSKRSGGSSSGGVESAAPSPSSSSRDVLAAPSTPVAAAGTAPRVEPARRRSSGAVLELPDATPELLEQRRGSAGTLKASRWSILPRSRPPSRPSSSGSGAGASASPNSSSWGKRRREAAPRIASELAATSMGPSPSSHEHPLPPPLASPAASSAGAKDIASFASYAFPGAEPQASVLVAPQWLPHESPAHAASATPVVAHYTTLLHAPKRGVLNPLVGPPRRASEAPPCTCATATPRRHSELPVVLPRVAPSPPVSRSASGQGQPSSPLNGSSTLYPRRSMRANANRSRLITQLAGWDFCSLDLSEEELRTACVILFDTALNAPLPRSLLAVDEPPSANNDEMTTMAQFLDIAPEAVRRLVDGIAELYHSSNAYHNVHHATDVLQALYVLLADLGALPKLVATGRSEWDARHSPVAPLDALALLFAAIGHDAGHPGLSNAYLGNAEAPIATAFRCAAPHHEANGAGGAASPTAAAPAARAPEGSPLESYHVLLLEGLLERCGLSQLTWAASGSRSELGSLIRTCVLATDMAIHARFVEELEAFERRLYGNDGAPATPAERAALIRARPREERTLLCSALLKCADVSNPVRVRSIGRRWSLALRREWERQSALEAECGLPATVGGGAAGCKRKHGHHKSSLAGSSTPLPNASTGDEEGLRRTSAAQMVAQIGGGGGAAADSAELSVDALVAAGELQEERSLAKGQVAFVRFFVTPLLDTLARIVPDLQPYAAAASENSVLWGKRLEQLDAVHAALESYAYAEPEEAPDEAALAAEEAQRLHGGFPAVLTVLAAERLRLPAIFLPPLPGAAPDAEAARLMVQHTLEDALASATRSWAAPLCEVLASMPSTPLVATSAQASSSSHAARPGIAASSLEADDRARTASSDSAVSSLGSLASSTPATAASSSTVATSSASAVGGVALPKSNGALQHQQQRGGLDAELGVALGSLPPISASSSSVDHAASTTTQQQQTVSKLQTSPTKPKRKPIDRMRRFIAGK